MQGPAAVAGKRLENILSDRVSDHTEEMLSERYLYLVKLALRQDTTKPNMM